MTEMKNILEDSFYQLIAIYALLVLLISFNFIYKYTVHFEILAVIVAVLGLSVVHRYDVQDLKYQFLNKKLHLVLFLLAIFFIFMFRAIPYINNNIPLGYDTGIYKYAIEHGLENQDNWVLSHVEPGFLYIMEFFKLFFSTDFILIWLFILFNVLLGISIYCFTSEYFGKKAGIISILIYSVSAIQFKVFTFMYYKNIIGLSLMLFSLYFLKKYENLEKGTKSKQNKYYLGLFILLGAFLGTIHRPTFYIFSLSYLIYAFISPYNFKKYNLKKLGINIISGVLILVIAGVFYLGKFSSAITTLINPVLQSFVQTGTAPGTFINFFTYQFSTLAYLSLAILGFLYLIKKRQFNILFFWTLINAIIVYFQFFFFNRFIIHLDIALIILASLGFSVIIENKKKLGTFLLILMLFSAFFVTFAQAKNAKPLIDEKQLSLIKQLQVTEKNASVMVISSEYSPWVLAYSNRKTIAPGLFDYDKWDLQQWNTFWNTDNREDTITLLSDYEKPIYLFAGTKDFDNPCFELSLQKSDSKIFKYVC